MRDDDPRAAHTDVDETRQARDSDGDSIRTSIARDLSELARELQAQTDPQAVMQRIVDVAARDIPGADCAAITLLDKGTLSSPAHTSARAARIGRWESETGDGPCVDTARRQVTIRCDDLRRDPPWPVFARRAVAEGIVSVLSFQLFVESTSMGALNVYSTEAHGLSADAEDTGLLLAAHAGVALSSSRNQQTLRVGLDTRDVIGQAKGVLMERYKIDSDTAFQLLVLSSQSTNTKLWDVADNLVTTGEIPGAQRPS